MAKTKGKTDNHDLTPNDKKNLQADMRRFGYLLPTNEEELEEFNKIFGKTQVMFPDYLKSLDFSKRLATQGKPIPVVNQSSKKAEESRQPKKIDLRKSSSKAQPNKKDYFKKLVLSAEIANQLHTEPTFGHVKFVKLQYLCDQVGNMKLSGNYQKFAAGPLDGKWIRQVDAEFKRRKWFNVTRTKYGAYKYSPGEKVDDYKKYFPNYFKQEMSTIQNFIDLLRERSSDFCEIVATIYYLMNEFSQQRKLVNNGSLVQGFYSWHDQKKRFKQDEIESVISWMYDNNIVPNK